MSISPSTNLLLIDASQRAGTFILPNPSTINGSILILRDIAGTLSHTSTLSIVTPTTHISIATLSLPSSFITLVAAPIGDKQYHVIGGNYLEYVNTSNISSTAVSTGVFISASPYANTDEFIPAFETLTTQVGQISTAVTITSSIMFGTNGKGILTQSNGSLYLDSLPFRRGKVYTPQVIQPNPSDTFPYQFISTSSSPTMYPLLWFDGKDSNYMFIDAQRKQHPSSIGDKVLFWYAKPSTSKVFAHQTDSAQAASYLGSNGLRFMSTAYGYSISNTDPLYSNTSSFPLAPDQTSIYFVCSRDPTKLGVYPSYMFGNTSVNAAVPSILFGYGVGHLTSNGTNLSTTIVKYTTGWFAGGSEYRPFTFVEPDGCNVYSLTRQTTNPSLTLAWNGLETWRGRATSQNYTPGINFLGSLPGSGYPYGALWGDFIVFNTIAHTTQQRQQMEGWLANRWGLSGLLPSTHIGATVPKVANAYRYYKWLITETQSLTPYANWCSASEFMFQLNGVDQSTLTSTVTVTLPSGHISPGVEPSNLVNNNLSSIFIDDYFALNYFTNVTFDFLQPQMLTGYRWATGTYDYSADPMSWTIQGSQDNTSWTLLHSVTSYHTTSNRNTYNPDTWQFTPSV